MGTSATMRVPRLHVPTALTTLATHKVSASRHIALDAARCSVFETIHNPERVRQGTKVLRARLRGPSMIEYYGEPISSLKQLTAGQPLALRDFHEEQRLADLAARRARGKVTPKKGEGRRAAMKRR